MSAVDSTKEAQQTIITHETGRLLLDKIDRMAQRHRSFVLKASPTWPDREYLLLALVFRTRLEKLCMDLRGTSIEQKDVQDMVLVGGST